jgi:hypothetical protein
MDTNVIAQKLVFLKTKAAVRSNDVADILGARPETVSRWKQGKAFPGRDYQRRLLDLEYIVEQLSDFHQPREARLWLYSRQKLLRGAIPMELIRSRKSLTVIEAIARFRRAQRDPVNRNLLLSSN